MKNQQLKINPLLNFSDLPKFEDFEVEHITPAIDYIIAESRSTIEKLAKSKEEVTWENFVLILENLENQLSRVWSQVGHINAVVNSPELREAYNYNLSKMTDFYADLGQDERLYNKFRALRASAHFNLLTPSQKKIVENELRDFRLGGAELPSDKKIHFKAIQEELSKLSSKFEENILDSTNDFALYIEDADILNGIPYDAMQVASEAARLDNKVGWKFTLHFPSYLPVLQYAQNRDLREKLYRAYATRASEFGKVSWDNTPLISQILKLKLKAANLLGYSNYGELSIETKMAESVKQVKDFLYDLTNKAKPYALKDKLELEEYAIKLGIYDMQAWDVSYVSEKLREEKYAFSDQEVKQYFPESKVLSGLFKVVGTIFDIHVTKSSSSVWHEDASFYDIKNHAGKLIGQFYLDLYARNNKRSGAWMDEAITRRKVGDLVTIPVAFLTCNFSAPVGNKPALFTHDEVLTMFHEFGHGLHHMLTQVDEYSVSGIKGVEWDAVELPSQFMENFCWEWEVLRNMTSHVDTGEQLPHELFVKMVAAKNFQAGMQTIRQIEFALFDIILHSDFDPNGNKTAMDLIETVRDQVAVVRPPKWNRFPNSFTHIFSGGYSAGYYSYKWAEVLSADAYSLFEENGVLNPETGKHYLQEILSKGGSRTAMESFKAFRGREPSIDALLRHNGMFKAA